MEQETGKMRTRRTFWENCFTMRMTRRSASRNQESMLHRRRQRRQFNVSQVDVPPGDFPYAFAPLPFPLPSPKNLPTAAVSATGAASRTLRSAARSADARALRSDPESTVVGAHSAVRPLGLPQCCSICLFIPDSQRLYHSTAICNGCSSVARRPRDRCLDIGLDASFIAQHLYHSSLFTFSLSLCLSVA